jgi:hypothetical protein
VDAETLAVEIAHAAERSDPPRFLRPPPDLAPRAS